MKNTSIKRKPFFIKLNVFRIAMTLSLIFHAGLFIFSLYEISSGEINPDDYKAVQLMDIEASAADQMTLDDGEIKVNDNKNRRTDSVNDNDPALYLPFFKVARLPEFTIKIDPVYPVSAKIRGIESEVIPEVYIDSEGKTRKIVVVKSGGEDFDRSVLTALSKSRFRPAISKEGNPVAVRVRIPFKFILD